MSFPGVWVIIPVFNEQESLPLVLRDLPSVGRVIVVDNGSTDRSGALAQQQGAVVICEPRRGYRWIARSSRHLERDWGIPRSSAQRWLTYLTEIKQYLVVEKWPFDLKKCRGQFTVHLRPNTPVLECAIYDAKDREDEIADARTHFMM